MAEQEAARMVDEALFALQNPRSTKGVSLQAIKKYSVEKYDVNLKECGPLIREYILRQIENGHLKRTSGKGAAGSFRVLSARARSLNAANKRKDESNVAHGSSNNGEKTTVPAKSHMHKQPRNEPRNRTVTAVNRKRASAPSSDESDADKLGESTGGKSTAPTRINKRRQSMHDRPGTSEESTLPRERSARAVNRKRAAAPSSDESDADELAENTASVKANKRKKPSNVVQELPDTSVESTLPRGRSAGAADRDPATASSSYGEIHFDETYPFSEL